MSNVPSDEKLYLVLGCFGRVDDGFISCSSCENKILLVHPGLYDYNGMMDYFDTCRLFDKPTFDFNAIRSFLQNMQGRFDQIPVGKQLWPEKHVQLFQKFMLSHRHCGLYLKLSFESNCKEEKVQDKEFKITSLSNSKKKNSRFNLKLVKGTK